MATIAWNSHSAALPLVVDVDQTAVGLDEVPEVHVEEPAGQRGLAGAERARAQSAGLGDHVLGEKFSPAVQAVVDSVEIAAPAGF